MTKLCEYCQRPLLTCRCDACDGYGGEWGHTPEYEWLWEPCANCCASGTLDVCTNLRCLDDPPSLMLRNQRNNQRGTTPARNEAGMTTTTTTRKRRTQAKPVNSSRAMLDKTMSEAALQAAVIEMAKALGWMAYHVFDSRRSGPDKGFPDWILARNGRVLALELKTERGKLSLAQVEWIYQLSAEQRIECYILRPHDWSSGHIEAILRGESAIGAA